MPNPTRKDSYVGYVNTNANLFAVVVTGHIGVTVDDVHKACERFEQLGVEFAKKPNDGITITIFS